LEIKLTQFSHGSGCGCKIAPDILQEIIKSTQEKTHFSNLLVGNSTKDDAAVWAINDTEAIISTTDFFMPIVDDPYTFGRIAATNAISDIYAMGGEPIMAIAILGFPIDKLTTDVAKAIIDGGKETCRLANIPLAGGHTIDSPEPFFGLAVTGRAKISEIKKNSDAQFGDVLFLTKPLGVGLIATAQKMGILQEGELQTAIDIMAKLNDVGRILGQKEYVSAMTDVTGFGFAGHLIEMCEGSNLAAEIHFDALPIIEATKNYAYSFIAPKGFTTNWKVCEEKVSATTESQRVLLGDPQTSGGLLIAVHPEFADEISAILEEQGLYSKPIGRFKEKDSEILVHIL
jgi:selenide, water dikinase